MNIRMRIIIVLAVAASLGLWAQGCKKKTGGKAFPVSGGVSGNVSKGPVKNGQVDLYAVGADGNKTGAILATATTDANGNFTLSSAGQTGSVIFEVSKGSYTDEATGANVDLSAAGAGDKRILICAIPKLSERAKPVGINPLTTMAQSLCTSQAAAQGIATAISNANAQVGALYKINDITEVPKDIAISPPTDVKADADKIAVVLAGLSQLAKDKVVSDALRITAGLAEDLADGDLDGKKDLGGTVVKIALTGGGDLIVQPDLATAALAASMDTFVKAYDAGNAFGGPGKTPVGAQVAAGLNGTGLGVATATLPTPPTITSITPSGRAAGVADTVTINGTGFAVSGTVIVNFGTTPATNVVVAAAVPPATTSVSITCTAPALSAGIYSVTVINPAVGTAVLSGTLASAWTVFSTGVTAPALTAVSPTSGKKAGGETIALTGTGFSTNVTAASTTVTVGGQPCSSVTVKSDILVEAATPVFSATGAKDVTITNSNGQSTKTGAFTVNANTAPTITFVKDSNATLNPSIPLGGGVPLVITGTGFSFNNAGTPTVTVGGVAANSVVVTVTDTTITCVAPPLATEGAKDVVLVNANTTPTGVTSTGAVTYVQAGTWSATSVTTPTSAPTARSSPFYVWTGTELIVFGGETGGTASTLAAADGGRYNPATDTWTAIATTGAPAARAGGEAVWTGSAMIIWGGENTTDFLADGGLYSPQTNTWTTMATGNAPTKRADYTAVWAGREMILWGGTDGTTTPSLKNAGFRYDPSSGTGGTWAAHTAGSSISTTSAPSARKGHTAVWTGREMIVWGGIDDTASPGVKTGAYYRPDADTWTATDTVSANLPEKRREHTAIWTGREMIVWGGLDNSGSARTATGGAYDPFGNTWNAATSLSSAPSARNEHTAVWTGKEMIVWGGKDATGSAGTATGARYTPSATGGAWLPTQTTGAATGRHDHAAVWTGRQMVVWGGTDSTTAASGVNTGSRYNPPLPPIGTWTATTATSAPTARDGHTVVFTGHEMIIWGGFSDMAGNTALATGARYNLVANTWTATSSTSAPAARGWHTVVWTGSRMIVWGGTNGSASSATRFNSGGAYDPLANAWTATTTTNAPAAREDHTAVWTGKEMVIWGGTTDPNDGTKAVNTGSKYTPASHFRDVNNTAVAEGWTATTTTNAPDARSLHTAVWTGSKMIVWGGRPNASTASGIGTPVGTGAEFDPAANAWTLTMTTNGAPIGRENHTAIWTGAEMIVWGGTEPVAGLVTNSGGRYNPFASGTTPVFWRTTDATDADAPKARVGHTAVWDGNAMIIWGGLGLNAAGNAVDTRLNTGGIYDVANDNWTKTSETSAPTARVGHTAIHDGVRMVIWGGSSSSTALEATGGILQ